MTPILQQFLSESRDFLQGIGEKLLQLESAPDDAVLMNELFRQVHTLKGNSGLFDYPEMSRVLHAGEDLMVCVRDGACVFERRHADGLLEAMDFVSVMLDEIEANGAIKAEHTTRSARIAAALRILIQKGEADETRADAQSSASPDMDPPISSERLSEIPEALRLALYRGSSTSEPLLWVTYTPEPECFFKGEDPFFQARHTPEVLWRRVTATKPWPPLADLDAFHCALRFEIITNAPRSAILEHFRYVPEQIVICEAPAIMLALPSGEVDRARNDDFLRAAAEHLSVPDLPALERLARATLAAAPVDSWLASSLRWLLAIMEHEPHNHLALRTLLECLRSCAAPNWCGSPPSAPERRTSESSVHRAQDSIRPIARSIIEAQLAVLAASEHAASMPGRLNSVAATLSGCHRSVGQDALMEPLEAALETSLAERSGAALIAFIEKHREPQDGNAASACEAPASEASPISAARDDGAVKFGRRAEDAIGAATLKVDQRKIDRLMSLIGEMVVAKNGIPFLATRAESVFGVRELSREIKNQYVVINRIAEEMHDAIMQVRMMPVSFVFQRFPRLVRDISRKLGKEVKLVLEGEDTEADKNIIEALADPLIHIVRNSLDHGIESPEARRAAGKPVEGRLVLRATQESDRVVIEITDDGRGIDPEVIKRKAYEKGLIDEAALERISDQEAINLVFRAGFSTVDVASDLSGRGVGMDVVRTALEHVNGTAALESKPGLGTRLRLSLPLSMAVSNVMLIESGKHVFGVPMDVVLETVRVPRSAIRLIKNRQTTVLRGRIVPLRSLNELMAADEPQRTNGDDEFAVLVIGLQNGDQLGVVVDDFREVVDIILKPMDGILRGLPGYAGSALLGDGSVLMVLNPQELV